MNHLARRYGFSFRYSIEAPKQSNRTDQPLAVLYAAAFNRETPAKNIGIRTEHNIASFTARQGAGFGVEIGEALFSGVRATGTVTSGTRRLEWDLRFLTAENAHYHLGGRLSRLASPSLSVCSPAPSVRVNGIVKIDEEEVILQDEPGHQSHVWANGDVEDTVRVHASGFEGHPDTIFTGLALKLPLVARGRLPLQSLMLRHGGEEHRFVRLRLAEQWRRNLGIGYWSFSAMNTRLYMEGSAHCRLRDMLQHEWLDPVGKRVYSNSSQVANIKLRLFRRVHGIRWRHIETVKARATGFLEHLSRSADPVVKAYERS